MHFGISFFSFTTHCNFPSDFRRQCDADVLLPLQGCSFLSLRIFCFSVRVTRFWQGTQRQVPNHRRETTQPRTKVFLSKIETEINFHARPARDFTFVSVSCRIFEQWISLSLRNEHSPHREYSTNFATSVCPKITFASHCTANQWYKKRSDAVKVGQDQSVSGSGV